MTVQYCAVENKETFGTVGGIDSQGRDPGVVTVHLPTEPLDLVRMEPAPPCTLQFPTKRPSTVNHHLRSLPHPGPGATLGLFNENALFSRLLVSYLVPFSLTSHSKNSHLEPSPQLTSVVHSFTQRNSTPLQLPASFRSFETINLLFNQPIPDQTAKMRSMIFTAGLVAPALAALGQPAPEQQTVYSTELVTVTSCAATVTDCPARSTA